MPAFVDDAAILSKGKPRFHLTATTVEELHAFAKEAGINRCWFHRGARFPHYDITAPQRDVAIAQGAEPVRWRDIKARTQTSALAVPTGPLQTVLFCQGPAVSALAREMEKSVPAGTGFGRFGQTKPALP
jgi:hypothetical protein